MSVPALKVPDSTVGFLREGYTFSGARATGWEPITGRVGHKRRASLPACLPAESLAIDFISPHRDRSCPGSANAVAAKGVAKRPIPPLPKRSVSPAPLTARTPTIWGVGLLLSAFFHCAYGAGCGAIKTESDNESGRICSSRTNGEGSVS